MDTISLETKKAHAAETRRSSYAASLRLEGFKVTVSESECKLPSRDEALKAFAKTQA